jgi:hypothetical protein
MRKRHAAMVCLALCLTQCDRGPAVVADGSLHLRRVVIYRNGVGYFERQGHVRGDHVEFRVRQSEVGDFLATLAVMERGGASVRSAAFPMPDELIPGHPLPPDPRRTVRLGLDGREHDLVVGYMVETPIWRPTYRLVFSPQGAQVQAWGIVQNLSGEDWNNVQLSLVAGSPVAFRSELAEAVVSPRPLVTDRGEVIDAVPRGETTLAQRPQTREELTAATVTTPTAAPPVAPTAQLAALGQAQQAAGPTGGVAMAETASPHAAPARAAHYPYAGHEHGEAYNVPATGSATPVPVTAPEAVAAPFTSAPRSVASLAAVAEQGGLSRFDLPQPVNIPNHSATMVMISARDVPGAPIYLFAPDPGVADSAGHPFRVARFENRTGALLERGPIAFFEAGAFLGQGMLDPLPDGATAMVPFALERGVSVTSSSTQTVEGARLLSAVRENLTIERYNATNITFTARNGQDRAARIMARVALGAGTTLYQPPRGTEQANDAALVPIEVPARGQATVTVQTRVPFTLPTNWYDTQAVSAVEDYLRAGHPDAGVAQMMRDVLALQNTIAGLAADRASQDQQRHDLMVNTDETRQNLLAIEHSPSAGDLRARLTRRLADNATRIDLLTRRIVELEATMSEQRVRLSEATRGVNLSAIAWAQSPPADVQLATAP